ncbi:MAG: hypothetical protein AAF525_01590 [Pseudomonadota bacterium]
MKFVALVAVFLVLGVGAWLLFRTPPLEPNQIRVTYHHDEVCVWNDWSFRIRRQTQNNRVRGNALSALPGPTLQKDDDVLRVYDADGNWFTLGSHQINAMVFDTKVDSDNASQRTVTRLTLQSDEGDQVFEPIPLPKFSRSRVLVPIATFYWPEQDADHMTWGNVRMTLAGTPEPGCSIDREISLTRPGHPKGRTPRHVEFPDV